MMWFALIFLVLLIPLAAVVLDSQLGRALASRLETRRDPGVDGVERRVAVLESEVERLGMEVQRLEEESRFLRRLLADRPPPEGMLPPHERHG